MPRYKKLIAHLPKACLALVLALSLLFSAQYADAGAKKYTVKADTAKVMKSPDKSAEVLLTVKKNKSVSIYETRGDWAKVTVDGKKGFMHKSAFTAGETSSKDSSQEVSSKSEKTAKYRNLSSGSSGSDVLALQNRLIKIGYLSKSGATGKYSSATVKAVKTFQLQNGLTANGKASVKTQEKLYSSGAKKKKSVVHRDWFKEGISSVLPRRGSAVIVDVKTGTRIAIRRVGGVNHADVEPKTAEDTAKLKSIYGGSWSWDSRPVILIAGGKFVAAAINGMPHGDEISTTNNFDGQFCLHTRGSKTHGTDSLQSSHQSSISYAYSTFN